MTDFVHQNIGLHTKTLEIFGPALGYAHTQSPEFHADILKEAHAFDTMWTGREAREAAHVTMRADIAAASKARLQTTLQALPKGNGKVAVAIIAATAVGAGVIGLLHSRSKQDQQGSWAERIAPERAGITAPQR